RGPDGRAAQRIAGEAAGARPRCPPGDRGLEVGTGAAPYRGGGEEMKPAEFWAERSGRERTVLAAGAAVALALALYGLLWEPGLKASAKLSASLPRLRAQVEDMRAQQKEILQLRKTAGTTASQVADLRALLRAAVARSPLAAAAPSLEWQTNDRVVFAAAP